MPRRPVDPQFAHLLRDLIAKRGVSLRALAAKTYYTASYLSALASGKRAPSGQAAKALDDALTALGRLAALGPAPAGEVDESAALELARRVSTSDVGTETLAKLEDGFDRLAVAYVSTEPDELLPRIRQHLAYITRLMDARATLEQRKRLIVVAGWTALLAATVQVDIRALRPAGAWLRTADALAEETGHAEIRAWCVETRAWEAITRGDYLEAVRLSRQAQGIAPANSSALMQATAQEGRAWARMGALTETLKVLDRVPQMVSALPRPTWPEHHYQYDPDKALWYTATTLAWVGDPAAEEYARGVIAMLERQGDAAKRPRRIATARLDLSLALMAERELEEASAEAVAAITSGWVVPSNWWRANEVLKALESAGKASDVRDAYEEYRPVT